MRSVGAERVIHALFSSPRLSVRAYLATLYFTVKRQAEEYYKTIYITDALQIISENISHISGGAYMAKRYADILNPPKVDTRSVEEIAEDVLRRAGVEVIKN